MACQDDQPVVRTWSKAPCVRFCAVAFSLIPFGIAAAQLLPDRPGVITSAYQTHTLPTEEAKRGVPVRFRATVTYYDPYIDPRRGALMDGRVWVESEPGQGSTFFTATFPLTDGPSAAQAASQVEPDRPALTRPLPLLLAEDNPVNRLLAIRALEKRLCARI